MATETRIGGRWPVFQLEWGGVAIYLHGYLRIISRLIVSKGRVNVAGCRVTIVSGCPQRMQVTHIP